MISIEEIVEEFRKEYNRNPRDWHVLVGYDEKNKLNIYIGRSDEDWIWAILTEPHFGIGERIDNVSISELFNQKTSFGLRKIPDNLTEKLNHELLEYGKLSESSLKILKMYVEMPPQREKDVLGSWVLHGPVAFVPSEYELSRRIKNKYLLKAREELKKEFDKQIMKRYRYIG